MKPLTVYQPYASLIALRRENAFASRLDTDYKGELAIFAGRSQLLMSNFDAFETAPSLKNHQFAFGAVVAIATLVDCVSL